MNPLPILTEWQQENFWCRVAIQGPQDCWFWEGDLYASGAGRVGIQDGHYKAHRLAYFLKTGIDPENNYVRQVCQNCGCCNPAHMELTAHRIPRTKLTEDDVRSIRSESAKGATQTELSRDYDVTRAAIYKIVTRKTWTHI
jgi:hypothetical protein